MGTSTASSSTPPRKTCGVPKERPTFIWLCPGPRVSSPVAFLLPPPPHAKSLTLCLFAPLFDRGHAVSTFARSSRARRCHGFSVRVHCGHRSTYVTYRIYCKGIHY